MISEGLTFDDVLLVPKFSKVQSRSLIDLSVYMGPFKFDNPIIPANMKTVTGYKLLKEIVLSGGLGILHRFMSIQEQLECFKSVLETKNAVNHVAASIGVKADDKENVKAFYDIGVKIFCIDVAHGDSAACIDMTAWIRNNLPDVFIISGNVASKAGAKRLWLAGANIVKVGVGPGSLCTTRIETGNGVPQLTAIMNVAEARAELSEQYNSPFYFVADGGIKNAGDIVKALCFADMVMVGNLFAGCEESPGEILLVDGLPYKQYVGSSTHKTNHIEGVAALVPTKGKFKDILTKLLEGIASGCSYQGVSSIISLKNDPQFVRITNAGLKESHPHDVRLQ